MICGAPGKPGQGGSDVEIVSETLCWDPTGNQSRPVKVGHQPEASLAWHWGNPCCEA